MTSTSDNRWSTLRFAATVIAVLVATTADAHAYIDPGTGAMIIQIIGALIAGALFYFRALRDWIKSLFTRRPSGTTPDSERKD